MRMLRFNGRFFGFADRVARPKGAEKRRAQKLGQFSRAFNRHLPLPGKLS
jgi:hypothetical protein